MISEIAPQQFSFRNLYADNCKIPSGVYDKEYCLNYKSPQLFNTTDGEYRFAKVSTSDYLALFN